MADINSIRQAIVDELLSREDLTPMDIVNCEQQFDRNLRMRNCGLLTTDISQYDNRHSLFVYAEELAVGGDWFTVIRQQGYEEYHEILR